MSNLHPDRPPLPRAPQFDDAHARRWCDEEAARAYRHRAPYPPHVFAFLLDLIADAPRTVLDIGCGTGNVTRALAPFVARVDAIDLAAEMIAEGRRLPGGDHPNITWRQGLGEDAPLDPPYALVVGAQSLHWMRGEIVLPRLARAMTANASLAVVTVIPAERSAWSDGLEAIIKRHSTAKDYVPFDMIPVWENAGLFHKTGEITTPAVAFTQSLADFIAAFHANSTLTAAHIDAPAFDAEVSALMTPYCADGCLTRPIAGQVVWGRPLGP